jgi:hypothetical protein
MFSCEINTLFDYAQTNDVRPHTEQLLGYLGNRQRV